MGHDSLEVGLHCQCSDIVSSGYSSFGVGAGSGALVLESSPVRSLECSLGRIPVRKRMRRRSHFASEIVDERFVAGHSHTLAPPLS